MPEVEEKAEAVSLEQVLGIVRRRRWHFLIPFFMGWLLVWAASWVLPPQYKSGTLILVEQPTMPKDYVMPNVNDDLQERIQGIQQQILSRTRLLHIIDQLNLYPQDRKRMSPDDLVVRMRKDIEVTLVHDESKREVTAFSVTFTARDPRVAQQVTSELTNLFISQNLEVRQQESEDTTKFLESQLEEARKNLAEQEEKVREFKTAHPGELPTQLQSNLQILSGLQTQLQSEQDQLNAARQQNAYLQSMMAQYKSYPRTAKGADGTPTGLAEIDAELEKQKAQLADLLSRYTDRHPDVRKVKDQIAQTEKMRAQVSAELKAGAQSSAGNEAKNQDSDPTESGPIIQVQGQLKANQAEIANRERSVAGLEAKINQYQGNLSQEPAVEQQYIDLTRGYDQSKTNYDSLLNKKNESQMATSMELRQQGEHFQMIDPPSLPLKPDFPNRLKLCLIGLGVGLVLGGALAGGTEFLDGRLHTEKAIKAMLATPVLAEIPPMVSPAEQQSRLRNDRMAWMAAGIVFATILVGSAISYLRG